MSFKSLSNPSSWRRLSIATWKVPDNSSVYGFIDVEATPVLRFLEKINQASPVKITITHLIAKAVSLILEKYPDINGIIRWKKIYLRDSVDLFLQVAMLARNEGESADLSGAVIRQCEKKNIVEIANELAQKGEAIRKRNDPQFKKTVSFFNKIPVFLLSWFLKLVSFITYNLGISSPKMGLIADPFGSAMITNLGSFGMPPALAPLVPMSRVPLILCLGAISEKPWVIDGKVEVRPVFQIAVTFDHRFMDGITASKMYKMMKEILDEPEKWIF